MKKILVTGGAGFIGSHLCDRLLESGNEVTCLDNLYTGSITNIKHLVGKPGFRLLKRDVTKTGHIECDEIYNLACPASPVHYQNDPVKTIWTSVGGAVRTLEIARKNNARILQASTSEVYGDPDVHPQTESYRGNVSTTGPRSCYDEGKRCAETLFMNYHTHEGVKIRIIRIFNTYGPRMRDDDGRVVSNFIVQALKGEDLTIFGDGSQTRSFQYVTDLIDAMVKVMQTDDSFTGPVNIGNPAEFTIAELARKIIKITGSASGIVYRPLPHDDPRQRQPDISLARSVLGWKPVTELGEGLELTIDFFKKQYKL
ncbi:MAG TPA: UDP-glucuronic acid decarboxylase family protein [Bacteroidales bacterium]|nr:UDP-glucuronic acid decarboxylase family protein [Bacteroidales bacterium]